MKLIVLRGPSGSGKSSTAKLLRSRFDAPTALIEQDFFRRVVLKEKDIPNGNNHDLIKSVVLFSFVLNMSAAIRDVLVIDPLTWQAHILFQVLYGEPFAIDPLSVFRPL